MVTPIGIRAVDDDDSSRIADEAVAQWRGVLAALSPVIGGHGVGALYRRTVFLARELHPWLEVPGESATIDFEHLRTLLAWRDARDAVEARDTLSRIFIELLSSLIGASLAQRLLPAGFPNPTPGPAAQDPQP
jgi:hypothetical protein